MIVSPNIIIDVVNRLFTGDTDRIMRFAFDSEYIIEKIEDKASNTIVDKRRYGVDGAMYQSSNVQPRVLSISGYCRNDDLQRIQKELNLIFNPQKHLEIYINNTLTASPTTDFRTIFGMVQDVPSVYWSKRVLRFDVDIYCFYPWFRGEVVSHQITNESKNYIFPATGRTTFSAEPNPL